MKNGIHPEGYAVTRKKTNADRIRSMTDAEVNKIGKTVFFTRKEAETKLKEMEGEHDFWM